MSHDIEALLEPISAEAPCGENLEDTQLLAGFDAYRLFGSDVPLPKDTEWRVIREHAFEALDKSHDLRLLAYLAAATVRIEGLLPFCTVLTVADRWLTERWELVFPRVDEDALLRKNALNCFADRMGIVDALRRTPIISHRQLGPVCLRDWELATGQVTPAADDTSAPNSAQIEATFAGTAADALAALAARLNAGISSLRSIIATMQTRASFESSPDFDPLLKPLSRIEQLLAQHSPVLTQTRAASGDTAEGETGSSVVAVGNIKSRQDAIRAIDAITTFFRQNEPSSPVPLLLDRAKRLVSKSFMEVLEDIAPDSLTQAKLVGGIKGDEG
jgi:type VI secretion system protein ImpA